MKYRSLILALFLFASCKEEPAVGSHQRQPQGYYDMVYADNSEGMIKVMKGKKYGFVNTRGEEVVPVIYEEAEAFMEGLSVVKKGGKWGFVDSFGKVQIDFKFDAADGFINGFTRVKLGKKTGVINKKGELVIPAKYVFIDAITRESQK